MNEPSIRNVALLPVVAVVAAGVFALSTVVAQGAPNAEDCGPGAHSMAMGEMDMGGADQGSSSGGGMDMGGMDHSAHMMMGDSGGGCMGDDAMQGGANSGSGAATIDPPTKPSNDMTSMDKGATSDADKATAKPEVAKKHASSKHGKHAAH